MTVNVQCKGTSESRPTRHMEIARRSLPYRFVETEPSWRTWWLVGHGVVGRWQNV